MYLFKILQALAGKNTWSRKYSFSSIQNRCEQNPPLPTNFRPGTSWMEVVLTFWFYFIYIDIPNVCLKSWIKTSPEKIMFSWLNHHEIAIIFRCKFPVNKEEETPNHVTRCQLSNFKSLFTIWMQRTTEKLYHTVWNIESKL